MRFREALEIQAALAPKITSSICTQVSIGMAESLIVDLGDLAPVAGGQFAGEYVLAIECPWRIDAPEIPVVGWDDNEEDVADLATVLIGASVNELDVRRPGFDLTIQFSNEHRLRVFPDCRAYYVDEMSGGALPWRIGGRGIAEPPAQVILDDADDVSGEDLGEESL